MTKTPITPEDIRKGDLIRCESIHRERYDFTAMEYKADYDKHELPARYGALRYYLLERPEPLFEPYWGMRIQDPLGIASALYVPGPSDEGRHTWAATLDGWHLVDFEDDEWAKKKLAEGWIEIKESNND